MYLYDQSKWLEDLVRGTENEWRRKHVSCGKENPSPCARVLHSSRIRFNSFPSPLKHFLPQRRLSIIKVVVRFGFLYMTRCAVWVQIPSVCIEWAQSPFACYCLCRIGTSPFAYHCLYRVGTKSLCILLFVQVGTKSLCTHCLCRVGTKFLCIHVYVQDYDRIPLHANFCARWAHITFIYHCVYTGMLIIRFISQNYFLSF